MRKKNLIQIYLLLKWEEYDNGKYKKNRTRFKATEKNIS